MGSTTLRHWDAREYESRPALAGDAPSELFHAYIPHPIAGWAPDLSARTWQLVSSVTQRCEDLAPVDKKLPAEWLLNRAESIASSSIEGIRPSPRRVARAEARASLFGEQPAGDETQTLRNIEITAHAREFAATGQAMTVEGLRQLHTTLMGEDPIAGQIRTRQNWVGAGLSGGPRQAHHVGPPPEAVPALLDDLVAFINAPSDENPLVRAAIAHSQFETIHPFPDGNGRTGRALLQYMYLRDGLSGSAALPVSAALMLTKLDYFNALDATRIVCTPDAPERSKAFQAWIELLAGASDHACRLHERLNTHIETLLHNWNIEARRHRIRPSSAPARLIEHLPAHPVVTAASARELLDTNERTARNAVSRLAAAGILAQRSAGRRNKVFECTAMMDAFTEAAREQPADNLSLLSQRHRLDNLDNAIRERGDSTPAAESQCGAATTRGGMCTHPKPRPGGACQAGHPRHA
jgi:Fic family protein